MPVNRLHVCAISYSGISVTVIHFNSLNIYFETLKVSDGTVIGTTRHNWLNNSLLCKSLSMHGVIFLEYFNRNHLFLCAGCLVMNLCV